MPGKISLIGNTSAQSWKKWGRESSRHLDRNTACRASSEARICTACLRNGQEARMAGAQWSKGRVVSNEFRGEAQYQATQELVYEEQNLAWSDVHLKESRWLLVESRLQGTMVETRWRIRRLLQLVKWKTMVTWIEWQGWEWRELSSAYISKAGLKGETNELDMG